MKKIVRQVGYLQGVYRDARSTKHKKSTLIQYVSDLDMLKMRYKIKLDVGNFQKISISNFTSKINVRLK
jgi:hypothetical protein